ncbi:YxiJ family protein [Niallia oryzisoli]|uniref:YxiJ family protein n=1 Tax=Niallia oryzisoli TaxID=1737571 RepID=UPI003735DA73
MVINIDKKDEVLKLIKERLYNPFPYQEFAMIQADYEEVTLNECPTGDLNTYWLTIAGTLSYVLRGRENSIPKGQIEWMYKTFFDCFPQFSFLKTNLSDYPLLYEEFMNYETVRQLLIEYLSIK